MDVCPFSTNGQLKESWHSEKSLKRFFWGGRYGMNLWGILKSRVGLGDLENWILFFCSIYFSALFLSPLGAFVTLFCQFLDFSIFILFLFCINWFFIIYFSYSILLSFHNVFFALCVFFIQFVIVVLHHCIESLLWLLS